MSILVTGGAGFIGSHTCVELINAGHDIVIVDNLYNSCVEAVKRIEKITGKNVKFYEVDLLDREGLNAIFDKEDIDSVIHFAGYKAVGESVRKPIEYYYNNITGTLILCDVMRNHGCKSIVFSSSATVYAAAGGALSTVSVDSNSNYLEISKKNMRWSLSLLSLRNRKIQKLLMMKIQTTIQVMLMNLKKMSAAYLKC